ncbi:phage tail tape measure protein [Anatilimnocola floriformis]|uniref:phage tail tape measure protein n=1 Tax=Anatilimnocola floriformis TaxID=2948575 RepID=UPI0020C3DB02|nr:phage tail tape measure protein [Anatilimnocola floriformis]
MTEIVQRMGFDASNALAAIAALDSGLNKLQQSFANLGQTIGQFNNTAKNFATAASGMASSVQTSLGNATKATQQFGTSTQQQLGAAAQAFNQNVPQAVQHTERLTTSLGLLSRIVYTQAIIRALSQLRNALQDTAKSAIDFQKQVALTTTIADGAKFDEIAVSVRKLSDEFNIPLLQATEATYNALSNQVGDFQQSLTFTAEAARFAKATNSSLKDSVDLLSAALRGFNLSVDDTDKVSSIFFATIDRGRINASELANSFGRIDTIASDLGVSLEETGGALAAISVRGTKTSEALTQLRAILSALQKPSETMEKQLAEMGFSSSELAIKTLGLSGVLKELSASTGGSAEQMAKLFPNIRGLSGATSLTSDDLGELTRNINEMTNAGREFNREKFLAATDTDAERVTAALNKLRNEMTVNLGQATLDTADKFFKFAGGAENIIATTKQVLPALAGITAGFVTLRLSITAANSQLGLLSKGLNGLALVPIAAGIGQAVGNAVESKRMEALFRDLNKLKAEDKTFLQDFQGKLASQRDAFNKTNEARVQAALQVNQKLNAAYLQDVANAKTAEEKKAAFDKFKAGTKVDEAALGKVLGRELTNPDQVSRGLIDAQKKAAELKAQIDTALSGQAGADRLRGNLDSLFQTLERLKTSRAVIGGGEGEDLRQQFAGVFAELQRLRDAGKFTEEELAKVIEARNKLGSQALAGDGFFTPKAGKFAFASTLNALDEALGTFQEIQRVQSTIGNIPELEAKLAPLQKILQAAAPAVTMSSAMQSTSTAAASLGSTLQSTQSAADSIAKSAAATAASYQAAASAAAGIGGQAPVSKAAGGLALAAGGQAPQGTDTVSAMLTPGEFVVNARSAAKFFPQFQQVNAGIAPRPMAAGSTTNLNGDINLNLHGEGDSKATAREVMAHIRRELRRGTAR